MIDLELLARRARYARAHDRPVFLTLEEWADVWHYSETRRRNGIPPLEPTPLEPEPGSQLFGQDVQVAEIPARDQTTSAQLWNPALPPPSWEITA